MLIMTHKLDRSPSMEEEAASQRDWSSLPDDVLLDILVLLPWSSRPRFAAACRHWRSVVMPFYPAWLTPLLLNAVNVGSTSVRYYSPYYNKIFEVDETLEAPNARIHCANGHQLTLCHRASDDDRVTVVHTDLASGVIHDLCPLESTFDDFIIYDGDRMIFCINATAIVDVARTIRLDGDDWYNVWEVAESTSYDPRLFRASPMTNPVLHQGLIYMLSIDGKLVVLDNQRYDEGFRLLDKPKGFGFECDDCYLLESDEGELMAVLMGQRGSPLHIMKLNEQTMEWEIVESLGGRALFTGTLRTVMVKTDVKWMQNKVILPRLYDWPEIIPCDLLNRGGELAFVPNSPLILQDGGADGKNMWTTGLGQAESSEFWGTFSFDSCVWVNFEKLVES